MKVRKSKRGAIEEPKKPNYSAENDSLYEFDAPKFRLFNTSITLGEGDSWFERRVGTPITPMSKSRPIENLLGTPPSFLGFNSLEDPSQTREDKENMLPKNSSISNKLNFKTSTQTIKFASPRKGKIIGFHSSDNPDEFKVPLIPPTSHLEPVRNSQFVIEYLQKGSEPVKYLKPESLYEFEAPRWRDFNKDITFGSGDSWFDKRQPTPVHSMVLPTIDFSTFGDTLNNKQDLGIANSFDIIQPEKPAINEDSLGSSGDNPPLPKPPVLTDKDDKLAEAPCFKTISKLEGVLVANNHHRDPDTVASISSIEKESLINSDKNEKALSNLISFSNKEALEKKSPKNFVSDSKSHVVKSIKDQIATLQKNLEDKKKIGPKIANNNSQTSVQEETQQPIKGAAATQLILHPIQQLKCISSTTISESISHTHDPWLNTLNSNVLTPINLSKELEVNKKLSNDRQKAPIHQQETHRLENLMTNANHILGKSKNHPPRKSPGVQKRNNVRRNILGITIPKPFKFHSTTRFNTLDQIKRSPYVPLAVRVQRFLKETPDRFKSKVINRVDKPVQLNVIRTTKPKSPCLRTKLRSKPKLLLTTEERQQQEQEKFKFKAKPINRRIFEHHAEFGMPRPKKLELTIPRSPLITKPKSQAPRPPSPPHLIKATPAPDMSAPFQPILSHRRLDPPEFSLPGEEISRRKNEVMQINLKGKKLCEENARKFKARPLPSDSPDALPPIAPHPVTHPNPFKLKSDQRGENYQHNFRQKLNLQEQHEKQSKQFRANPVHKVVPNPPKKSTKALTEPRGFNFRTDKRLAERKILYTKRKMQDIEVENRKAENQKEEMERTQNEIRQIRSELIHHAKPIKYFAPLVVQPSNKSLTKPISPMLGDKRKHRPKALQNSNIQNISQAQDKITKFHTNDPSF
ncbi:hypothetical protein G9A89_019605 [Geosiphon pyriformis]|nr:hypothetical protein G9A89_019605 [Geosiphon pyriformis]